MKLLSSTFVALACVWAAAGCSSRNDSGSALSSDRQSSTAGAESAADRSDGSGRPISVSGCLQEGDGGSFIVTSLNEASRESVGTTGAAGSVAGEQRRAASRAYRIEAESGVDLESMIGKEVRVSGTLVDGAALPRPSAANAASGNGGDRARIDEGDLAKIQAASVTRIADLCGATGSATSPDRQ